MIMFIIYVLSIEGFVTAFSVFFFSLSTEKAVVRLGLQNVRS